MIRHATPRLLGLLITSLISALACAGCSATPAVPRARVLLVTGEDYPGHLWRQTAPVVAALLAADPELEVETVDDLSLLCADRLRGQDVVVMHFKNYDPAVPGRAAFDDLAAFVADGGGLVLLHFACGAFQEFEPDFVRLAGRTWNPDLRGHDPHGPFAVEITAPDHPVTAGLAPFETTDELYTCLDGDTPIEVVAHARSRVDGVDYPIAFVLEFGAGRVFHTTLGHDVAAFQSPGAAALVRRGTAWAANRAAPSHAH